MPAAFFQEWERWQADFAEAIETRPERIFEYDLLKVVPKVEFDDSHFTPRELRLMQALADRFREERSQPLINFIHVELGPWSKIWDSDRGFNQHIPYALAIPDADEHAAAVREFADEQASMRSVLGTIG